MSRQDVVDLKEKYVKEGATIGANATVVCGVILGRSAFIGAGTVVTEDVPDYALVYGNPAKIKGWMCECGEKLEFRAKKAKCYQCGREYEKSAQRIIRPVNIQSA